MAVAGRCRSQAAVRRAERRACWCASRWRCCCGPGCGSASTPPCAPVQWCTSVRGPGRTSPVGKLREDRCLPLHPHLAVLIDGYRGAAVRLAARPAPHPLMARRRRRPGCTPWPAWSPRPSRSCPKPSMTRATRNSP